MRTYLAVYYIGNKVAFEFGETKELEKIQELINYKPSKIFLVDKGISLREAETLFGDMETLAFILKYTKEMSWLY